MKNHARLHGKSLNNYVEGLIKKDLDGYEDRYESLYAELAGIRLPEKVSPEVDAFMDRYKVEFSEEEIDADDKLAYLLSR